VEVRNKEMEKAVEEIRAKFQARQQRAKDASKKVLSRLSNSHDMDLKALCVQSWIAAHALGMVERKIDTMEKKAKQRHKDSLAKKSAEARSVLDRMSASSDTGLLHMVLTSWIEAWKVWRAENEIERVIVQNDAKFKRLNVKQKASAMGVMSKCLKTEDDNILETWFSAWSAETREQHVIKVYSGKIDQKKHQMDAVQTMFRSFANQLEQGIGNTPRSKKSTARSRGGEGSTAGAASSQH